MTGFSIHQSTSHKLTTTLPLTKEVVPNASKITHAYSFLIIWGFAVYSWFCASFLLLFKGVKMHSNDMPQIVYNSGRLEYRGFSYQHWSCHDSTEITGQGRQTDNFYCLESLSTFCLLKHFTIWRKNNYMLCKGGKKHMERDYSTDEIVILWVLQATLSLISWADWATWISVYFHAWVVGPKHCMCANSGIMSPGKTENKCFSSRSI